MVRHRALPWLLATVVVSLPARATEHPLVVTFQEAKSAYNAKRYDAADTSLRRLAELLAAPENAAFRAQVLPSYYFYTSAVAFERREEDRAREAVQQFLTLQPNVQLDASRYPKAYVKFFEVEKRKRESEPASGSLAGGEQPSKEAREYAQFQVDATAVPGYAGDAGWVETPVRALLQDADRKAFRALADDERRREFVEGFWKRLDPNPLTRENEFQTEFYRRVQYADSHFSSEAEKGALSDRGMVFLILGPPTLTASSLIDDTDDGRPVMTGRNTKAGPEISVTTTPMTTARTTIAETWIYRGSQIPKGIPTGEMAFRFYTRQGYGTAVLQKDQRYAWLLKAAQLLRNPGTAD